MAHKHPLIVLFVHAPYNITNIISVIPTHQRTFTLNLFNSQKKKNLENYYKLHSTDITLANSRSLKLSNHFILKITSHCGPNKSLVLSSNCPFPLPSRYFVLMENGVNDRASTFMHSLSPDYELLLVLLL